MRHQLQPTTLRKSNRALPIRAPSGKVREHHRRLDGHRPAKRPRKQKSVSTKSFRQARDEAVQSSALSSSDEEEESTEQPRREITLEEISDDESLWSESSDDEIY